RVHSIGKIADGRSWMGQRLSLFAMLIWLQAAAVAQIRSGSIVGTVVDPTGATVAGAEVAVVQPETGASYKSVTNESGQYAVPYLPFGEYRVTVRKTGFKSAEITGIPVSTSETVRVPVGLELGDVAASVEVTADAAGVEVESASVQGVTNHQLIESLPNLNDNPYYFATLLPGVVGRDEVSDGQTV